MTHPVSHAKAAWGKGPSAQLWACPAPQFGALCWALVSVPSPVLLLPCMALPEHCQPCVEGSAARCSGQLFADPFFPCLCPFGALEVLEEDASAAVRRQPLRRGPHGEV